VWCDGSKRFRGDSLAGKWAELAGICGFVTALAPLHTFAMKFIVPFLALTILLRAQEVEPVPAEHTAGIAAKLLEVLGKPADAPLATEVDADKAVAIKAGKAGMLAMPDKKLSPATLDGAGKDPVAVGQLWMHLVVPQVDKTAPDPDKLRTLTVGDGEKEAKVELYYLAVTKTEAGALELSLFAKDKTPLVKVPLAKTDAAATATPIALDGHKDTDTTGLLVISLFGSYKADLTVTKPRE
jgi:hypothetical protein